LNLLAFGVLGGLESGNCGGKDLLVFFEKGGGGRTTVNSQTNKSERGKGHNQGETGEGVDNLPGKRGVPYSPLGGGLDMPPLEGKKNLRKGTRPK